MNQRNEMLLEECLQSVQAHSMLMASLDSQLLQQVAGAGATVNDYLYGGFGTSVGIRAVLHALGRKLSDCERILDFGCGSARVLRWFGDVQKHVDIYACDIHPPAIEWCKANVSFGKFATNPAWPPLPYADGMFDLIYGISVFTHLDEAMQSAWLEELARITKDGGVVLLTVHGQDKAASDVSPEEYAQFLERGFLYKKATSTATVEGLPDFYQVAFHSEKYVRSAWSSPFEVLGYLPHGCQYAQDLVILRKGRPAEGINISQKLPMAAIDRPLIGTVVPGKELDIRGWAFHPDGTVPTLELWIDGRSIGTCTPSGSLPHVTAAFPTTAAAASAGFSLSTPIDGLTTGPHILWITLRDDAMPLWATFFYCSTERV